MHVRGASVELTLLMLLGPPACHGMVWHPDNPHNSMWDTWCARAASESVRSCRGPISLRQPPA